MTQIAYLPDPRPEPTLRSARLTLRAATRDDAEALTRVLTEPDVARWWGAYDLDRVREELPDGFAIVVDGDVHGWLLYAEETDPDYRRVGLDIALSSALHGQGYGTEAIRAVVRHFIARGHHRFTIDPALDNERAIRAYQAVGFRPVGVQRAYERAADGTWRDSLLLDLLADELVG
jgi:aminoglycoside 6'-N-acetyltransferase